MRFLLLLAVLGAGSASVLSAEALLVKAGERTSAPLEGLQEGDLLGVVVSLPALAALGEEDAVEVSIADAQGVVVAKTLHAGDPDLTAAIRARAAGPGRVEAGVVRGGKAHPVEVRASRMALSGKAGVLLGSNPSPDWRRAQPMELGKTVIATADERPYVPLLGDPARGLEDMLAGAQWFTFTWAGPRDVLVHFNVDILDRDVPVDVTVFTREGDGASAKLVPYTVGIERFVPERSTQFHGLYKFTPRVVRPGTYFVRVMGNHPWYALRTALYDPPPYQDPALAVRAGMDYLVKKGDSWHANTPRRGHSALRAASPLQETALCIACHPTHFTTRGELVAVENGYPVRERAALAFLTERLYQNPRPIYGLPDTSWVRMISAPGNVLSRLAYMEVLFERHVAEEARGGLLESVGNYLEKYWVGVKAPISESNGNAPRVSGFEVALHSALVFEELYRRTRDPRYQRLREQMEEIAASGEVLDMIDLAWKTVALATLGPERHREAIRGLVESIFAQEREDGTWSVVLDDLLYGFDYRSQKRTESRSYPKDARGRPVSSEFQTWHCIYALAKAGVSEKDPRLARAVRLCLERQWSHGGWQGNADYKNFDTPFRDTQYAVMALSELYKGPGSRGWDAGFGPMPESFSAEADEALAALDRCWKAPGPRTLELIRGALAHEQPLVRQAACAALGRIADAESARGLARALGDPSKLVRRAAAWALRQILTRRGHVESVVLEALRSPDDRAREGAMRVFHQHFRYLAGSEALARAVMERLERDPAVLVRMGAARALWLWWSWAGEGESKSGLEDVVIAALGRAEHPWVRRALVEGLHNQLDDNPAYLYNSWISGLVRPEDKDRVDRAWKANVLRQARKLREVLLSGNDLQRDGVLRALYTFHLRESGGDAALVARVKVPETFEGAWFEGYKQAITYDPLSMGTAALARIGNDHDPATFYEDSAPLLAEGLLAALASGKERLITGALKAQRHVRGVPITEGFALKAIELTRSAPPSILAEVQREAGTLLSGKVPHTEAVAAALGDRLLGLDGGEPGAADLVSLVASVKGLDERAGIAACLLRVSQGGSPEARAAALRVLLLSPRLLAGGPARKRFDEELRSARAGWISGVLEVLRRIDWKRVKDEDPRARALGAVSAGLAHASADVQRAALEVVKVLPGLGENPGILAALRSLAGGGAPPVQKAARALLEPPAEGGKEAGRAPEPPDFDFFARRVNPILTRAGADGESCADCHSNHVIFGLQRPQEVKDPEAAVREHYLSALKVVDLAKPEESLIVIKPRQAFDKIGVPGEYRNSHGGGVRWAKGTESEEHRLILEWIQGARLSEAEKATAGASGRLREY